MASGSWHARIFLANNGVQHRATNVGLMRQDQVSEAFRAIDRHYTVVAPDYGKVLTDITALVTVDLARGVRMNTKDDHLHLARWLAERIKRRSITA